MHCEYGLSRQPVFTLHTLETHTFVGGKNSKLAFEDVTFLMALFRLSRQPILPPCFSGAESVDTSGLVCPKSVTSNLVLHRVSSGMKYINYFKL